MLNEEGSLMALVDALQSEQRRLWLTGERIVAERHFAEHPELLDNALCALQLVYSEIVLREESGEAPDLDEYVRRFPQYADQLPPLFEVHRTLESGHLLDFAGPAAAPHGAAEQAAPTSATWPSVAGYEILSELGRGGMGVVYKARQAGLGRVVALKMILAVNQAEPAQAARFRAEARSMAQLHHPNIVQIYDVGEQDGRPFFAMEFLEAGSLATRLEASPQPARQAAELMETLAHAVHAAHQKGIIHRDLKPANILFQPEDGGAGKYGPLTGPFALLVPKIADFGLAKQLLADTGQTASGMILGTPSYVAPEQAEGKLSEVGEAADIYALGAILYEVLAGRPPFKAQTQLDTLRLVISEEPESLSRHLNVPRDLETICWRCLHKERRKRYATALALAEDLKRFLDGLAILARRAGPVERGWRWCRRNPTVATLIGCVMLLLATIAVGSSLSAMWWRTERDTARQAERDMTEKLADSYLSQARAARGSGKIGQRFESLKLLATAADITHSLQLGDQRLLELRNEAIACMVLPDVRWQRRLPSIVPHQTVAAFEVRFQRYAYGDAHGTITIRRTLDGEVLTRLTLPGVEKGPDYLRFGLGPTGQYLAAGYGDGAPLVIWDCDLGRKALQVPWAELGNGLSFRPGSCEVAIPRTNGVSIYDLLSGQEMRRLAPDLKAHGIAFSPDGSCLAVSTGDGNSVQILDAESGEVLHSYAHPAVAEAPAWRGDGRWLAVGCDNQRIYVWDTVNHQLLSELEGHQAGNIRVHFTRAGDQLFSTSWDGTLRLWDAGSGRQELAAAAVGFAGCNPDNGQLALIRGFSLGLFELAGGQELRILRHGPIGNRTPLPPGGPSCVDFIPNGRLLATASSDGVRLWDAKAARELEHLPIGRSSGLSFFPNGDLVAASATGLYRWALSYDGSGDRAGLTVSSAAMLHLPADFPLAYDARLARDHEGRLLALTDRHSGRALVYNVEAPEKSLILQKHPSMGSTSVSPKGDLIATSTWHGRGVKIWDAATAKELTELPCPSVHAVFSPDGRLLGVGSDAEFQIWQVGFWDKPLHVLTRDEPGLRGWMAFAPHERMLALASSSRAVRLIDPVTAKEFATLYAPDPKMISWMCFSPDGTTLAVATENHVVQLWDLRRIRAQLKEMRLDWE